jgi:hypothetical protein
MVDREPRAKKPNRLPLEAFAYYLSLGPSRSYEAVAAEYDVSRQAVHQRATRDHWQPKLERIEERVAERAERKAEETIEAMNVRHIRALRRIQEKAEDALEREDFDNASDASRAHDAAVARERLVRGQVSERVGVDTIADLAKRAYAEERARASSALPPSGGNGHGNGHSNGNGHGNGVEGEGGAG